MYKSCATLDTKLTICASSVESFNIFHDVSPGNVFSQNCATHLAFLLVQCLHLHKNDSRVMHVINSVTL